MSFPNPYRGVAPMLLLVLAAFGFAAHAQQWPVKPVRIVIPNSAGSSPDTVTRLVSDRLGKSLGQAFIVDNRPGANSIIAAELAAKASPDGYTYFLASPDSHAANLYRFKSLPYDPDRDFTPVANVIDSAPFVIAAHVDVPVRTYPDLVALAKSRPGQLGMAVTVGVSDVLARWMNIMAGTDTTIVPYKANPQAAQDAATGQVQLIAIALPAIDGFMRAGKLRAIAVSSSRRFPLLPDVPTLAETYPGLVIEGWLFLVTTTGTPPAVIQRMNRAVDAAVKEPEVVQRIRSFGFSASDAMTPETITQRIRDVRASWKKIATDIKMEMQ
jgi:tripartite-type tricarboxylate transporter receptor subunit TctC